MWLQFKQCLDRTRLPNVPSIHPLPGRVYRRWELKPQWWTQPHSQSLLPQLMHFDCSAGEISVMRLSRGQKRPLMVCDYC